MLQFNHANDFCPGGRAVPTYKRVGSAESWDKSAASAPTAAEFPPYRRRTKCRQPLVSEQYMGDLFDHCNSLECLSEDELFAGAGSLHDGYSLSSNGDSPRLVETPRKRWHHHHRPRAPWSEERWYAQRLQVLNRRRMSYEENEESLGSTFVFSEGDSFPNVLRIPCEEVQRAIKRNVIIGEGAYGKVYRGRLDGDTTVAIKLIPADHRRGFVRELTVLSMFRHSNIVCLMGYSVSNKGQAIVYEHMALGDVGSILHGKTDCVASCKILKHWDRRVEILLDVARALSYLHSRKPKIFHRDIKASNILVDKHGVAKLADFGLACQAAEGNCDSVKFQRSAEGTPGYADPKYMKKLIYNEYTDVYSLGIVILELLTGQRPAFYTLEGEKTTPSTNDSSSDGSIKYLLDFLDLQDPQSVLPFVDPRCVWPKHLPVLLATIAFACIHEDVRSRPRAQDVAKELQDLLSEFQDLLRKGYWETP